VRVWLIDYNRALEDARDPYGLEDDGQWELMKPELSFRIWQLCQRFDWRFPPFPGPVTEWPSWFLHDIAILEWQDRMIKRDMGLD
jgi:hypothetical protein